MIEKEEKVLNDPAALYGSNYTYADYLRFQFDEMVEIIRGKVFRMAAAPSSNHQKICVQLTGLFYNFFKEDSCQLFIAPFDVILPVENKKREESNTVVQPDLCVICDEEKIEEGGCFGAPDLIIEIISPNTSKKDLHHKYSVYEEAQVREYWTILPGEKTVVIYELQNKKFEKAAVFDGSDTLVSKIFPTLKIDLKEVFQESGPRASARETGTRVST